MMFDVQDELAEFAVTEAEFDAMFAEGEPAEVTGPPASGQARDRDWRFGATGPE